MMNFAVIQFHSEYLFLADEVNVGPVSFNVFRQTTTI